MRSAGASGTQGAGLAGTKDAATTNMPEVENFGPPAWRSVLNSKADLGASNVFVRHSRQLKV